LESLGDAVLGLLASEYLFRRFPEREEGDLTKMKSRLVCGANLARVAVLFGLGDHVLMSKGEEATGGRERASILADVVEALFGAVYLDGGIEAVLGVMNLWLFDEADELLEADDLGNNKSRLQELIQAKFKTPPRYRIVSTSGPDHDRLYVVEVSIAKRVLGAGRGHSKKIAEQEAAGEALAALERDPEAFAEENDD
jgi:ribonuclease-3